MFCPFHFLSPHLKHDNNLCTDEHDSDDSHDDELLKVVCHYAAKMSKGVTSAMHLVGWEGTRLAEKLSLIFLCTYDGPMVTHILQHMDVKMSHLCILQSW